MSKLKLNLKRRWVRSRPGSVLILVIALLVLLALIGTAYLSSTQTERYTSVQNTINTEADLLVQGLQTAVVGQIASGLYGGSAYRPPQQEMPTYSGGTITSPTPPHNGYFNYTSTTQDPNLGYTDVMPNLFLADRVPDLTQPGPVWNAISWPLFTDASGSYTFDSPFDNSVQTYAAVNKGIILATPGFKSENGVNYPAITLSLSPNAGGRTIVDNSGTAQALSTAQIVAASASGDGIADAGLFKIPVGQIDGITYYGAVRVIDGNSAINASSAWTIANESNNYPNMPSVNYGFFRSDMGLQELLFGGGASEIAKLNSYRFKSFQTTPVPDSGFTNPPTNFAWYSQEQEIEDQLVRRPGNPGSATSTATFSWLGQSATSALAYRYSLMNPSSVGSPTEIENDLAAELTISPSMPWSPSQSQTWFNSNFAGWSTYAGTGANGNMPLRTLLVGNNAVSNAVAARYGNSGASSPTAWSAAVTMYKFGDWVVDGPAGSQRSFVCIQPHAPTIANEPEPSTSYSYPASNPNTAFNSGAVAYWAGALAAAPVPPNQVLPGVPWSTIPVKTSINTATFEQLWLGFCQVMTDSVGPDQYPLGTLPEWQPPMQPVGAISGFEHQLGMFRNVVRNANNAAPGAAVLTSSQMLKLRAALAAVNAMDLRDGDDDVTSRHIVLTNSALGEAAQYDVEVYGTEKQPYISEVVIQTNGSPGAAANYIAVELCNPYPQAITLTNWQIGSITRTASPMMLSGGVPIPTVTIPAASGGIPGLLILEEGTSRPGDITTTIAANQAAYLTAATGGATPTVVTGLYNAAIGASNQPNELFIMRTRRADGTQTKSIAGNDLYDETVPTTNLVDYVPVDQIDLTDLDITAATASGTRSARFLYRRGTNGSSTATPSVPWHFIFPGAYDPTKANPSGRYYQSLQETTGAAAQTAIVTDITASQACNLAGPTGYFPYIQGNTTPATPTQATYTTMSIELNNSFMASPNAITTPPPPTNVYPFGQFARNGDMLKIPFIGAYRIRPVGTITQAVTELNSVTMDSALANDNGSTTYALPASALPTASTTSDAATVTAFGEQIGRFCPVGDPAGTAASTQLDFGPGYIPPGTGNPDPSPPAPKLYWHYHWAKKLFDYFTVQAPSDDYYPNVNPTQVMGGATPAPLSNNNAVYANYQTAGHSEETTGVEGLVNINTAPMPVLAQLPFYGISKYMTPAHTPGTTDQIEASATLAAEIVKYRTAHGPFQSIFDLYNVPKFLAANAAAFPIAPPNTAAGPQQGVFSPGGFATAGGDPPVTPAGAVQLDFQDRFLLLNNISNLITTRSDTFTCYVLLQGWRNVGTGNPTLAVQRRIAFLVDRNNVTPLTNLPSVFNIPN